MERPSPSQLAASGVGMAHHPGASPHSSSASLSSFLGGGGPPNPGGGVLVNPGTSPGSVGAGIMSMSLVGSVPSAVVGHHGSSPTSPSQHLHGSSSAGSSSTTSMAIRHEIQRFVLRNHSEIL